MIKGISGGRYITVTGGQSSTPYISPGAVGAGMVRYNSNMNCLEISDGNSWQQLHTSYSQVELDHEAQTLLDWAREERNKQLERTKLIKDNPALQKALEAIQRAEANFDLIAKFVENDTSDEQSGP